MPEVKQIVIVGGGFAGVYTARHLERLIRRSKRQDVAVTLVSRENYFLMTPLLFEAGSGVLEPRHAVNPIRPLLRTTAFVEAEVTSVDLESRSIHGRMSGDLPVGLAFDHLVLALGGVTNTSLVPGSEHARTFKKLADAIALRNHIIDLFERADVCNDSAARRRLLRFVVVGAGLVGVELMGELTEIVRSAVPGEESRREW